VSNSGRERRPPTRKAPRFTLFVTGELKKKKGRWRQHDTYTGKTRRKVLQKLKRLTKKVGNINWGGEKREKKSLQYLISLSSHKNKKKKTTL